MLGVSGPPRQMSPSVGGCRHFLSLSKSHLNFTIFMYSHKEFISNSTQRVLPARQSEEARFTRKLFRIFHSSVVAAKPTTLVEANIIAHRKLSEVAKGNKVERVRQSQYILPRFLL